MRADELNKAAANALSHDKIVYLCGKGANNYSEIYHSTKHNLKTILFLLSQGNCAIDNDSEHFVMLYLIAGAGRILEYSPKWLNHPAAIPYLTRRADINEILYKALNRDVIGVIHEYLSYELPEIPPEKIYAVEIRIQRIYNIGTYRPLSIYYGTYNKELVDYHIGELQSFIYKHRLFEF